MYPNRDTFEYLYPAWDTTASAQSTMESAVAGGRKNSLPVFTFVNKQSLSCIKISIGKTEILTGSGNQ